MAEQKRDLAPVYQVVGVTLWVSMLAFFFANVEIQIEGSEGWASSLPTWRIKEHWLLDIFWGGREMTGYHAWVFSFMFLFFHLPVFLFCKWTYQVEARILGCVCTFWIVEDFLWFVINPAYGILKFSAEHVSWHKHWLCGAPVDYWAFIIVAAGLFRYGYWGMPAVIVNVFKQRTDTSVNVNN